MTAFRYEARNPEGQAVSGVIQADDERLALRALRQRSLSPMSLAADKPLAKPKLRVRAGPKKAGTRELILFVRQLALLLEAGLTLEQALQSMIDAPSYRALHVQVEAVRRDLRQGQPLSVALKTRLPMLPSYVHQLVAAGERTGQLKQSLADGAAQMERDDRTARDIRNALTYPMVLVASGIGAVLFIFAFVVPRFATMFKNREADLPALSRIVMGAGTFFDDHLGTMAVLLVALAALLYRLWQMPRVRQQVYETALATPVLGDWLAETESGKWASLFATLLGNKVPLVESMEMASHVVRSAALRDSLGQVERAVRGGSMLATALAEYTRLSPIVVNLVGIGERSATLAEMLGSAARMSEENGRDRMKRVLVLIEPLAILLIGGVVGIVVVAIFMAVTSISNIAL